MAKNYTTTVTATTTPTGEDGWRIECTCRTHRPGQTAAVVRRNGDSYDPALVHGTVLGVHTNPLVKRALAQRGQAWAA